MLAGAYQTDVMSYPQLHEGTPPPFLAVFGISHLFLLHYSSVVWLEENVQIGYPYSNHASIHPFPPVPMHLPTFLAHASAISLSCLKAKVQSLCPQAEAVPISADGSISIMGITKSLFATHEGR